MSESKATILLLGGGYCLRRYARISNQPHVLLSSRVLNSKESYPDGVQSVQLDLADSYSVSSFFERYPEISQVVDSVPPFQGPYIEHLESFIEKAEKHGCRRFIYLSSTGVFGVTDGSEVDEKSRCAPLSDSAKVRLQAEKCYQESFVSSIVLRLSGIYGPDRSPGDRIKRGVYPVDIPLEKWTNRIHVDDIVAVISQLLQRELSPDDADHRIYVVSDDSPMTLGEVFQLYEECCGIKRADYPCRKPGAAASMRLALNQKLSNKRLKREIIASLKYPDLKSALLDTDSGAQ